MKCKSSQKHTNRLGDLTVEIYLAANNILIFAGLTGSIMSYWRSIVIGCSLTYYILIPTKVLKILNIAERNWNTEMFK